MHTLYRICSDLETQQIMFVKATFQNDTVKQEVAPAYYFAAENRIAYQDDYVPVTFDS